MSAHTPGPWAAERHGDGWSVFGPYVPGDDAHVWITSGRKEQDARLIAAAPDLLEALVGLMSEKGAVNGFHGSDSFAEAAARKAIAKAEGR